MKTIPRIIILLGIVVMAGCQAPAAPQTAASTVMTPSVSSDNDIVLKEGFTFSIRSCPFFECEEIARVSSADLVETSGYDGRSRDLASRQVWFLVQYGQGGSGWISVNPERMTVPEELLASLPAAEWSAPTPVPVAPTPTLDPTWVKEMLCRENVFSNSNPNKSIFNPRDGYTLRWQTPIQIFLNGNSAAKTVVENIKIWSGGLITFEIVDAKPAVGMVVNTGDTCNPDHLLTPTGSVNPNEDDCLPYDALFHAGADGYIDSVAYIHLGTKEAGYFNQPGLLTPYAIVEHEFVHALGLGDHFAGFTYEGFSQQSRDVLIALYSIPSGTDLSGECAEYK